MLRIAAVLIALKLLVTAPAWAIEYRYPGNVVRVIDGSLIIDVSRSNSYASR
jgi:hypothetical protein